MRPAHDLDALDVVDHHVREVEVAAVETADRDVVDDDLKVVGFAAAHANLRQRAFVAGGAYMHAGNGAQRVGDGLDAAPAQFVALQHGRACADAIRGLWRLARGNHDVRQDGRLRLCRDEREGKCDQRECGCTRKAKHG